MPIERWFYSIPLRLRSLFQRNRVEQDLDDELQDHLERKTADLVARGMTPADARRAALRAMDGLTQQKERCRETWGVAAVTNTWRDLRYSLRSLAQARSFSLVAIATLALAIGANSIVFGVLNGLILRPLDVPQPARVWGIEHGNEYSMFESYPDYSDLRDRNRTFEGIAAFNIDQVGLADGGNPVRSWIYSVSGNFFDVLHLQPSLGHVFHASDEHGPNSAPYIVLAYSYWRNRFQGDPGVIGRVVRVNKHPFSIIGVAPREFRGVLAFGAADFYAPMIDQEQFEGRNTLDVRSTQSIFMTLGRLKPGVTAAQAKADLDSIGSYLENAYPTTHGATSFVLARPGLYGNYMGGPMRAFITGLMLLAGLILLAACANLGSLFAARAADRSRELALRLALGAGRADILRQLLTEALLIALAGGALGLAGSIVTLRQLLAWKPFPRYPLDVPVAPDASVYLVAFGLAIASGLLFAIVPIRQALRADPYQVVKRGSTGAPGRRLTVRDLLLVAQIAICAVLVTGSLVALRGMARSLNARFGFNPHNVILADTDLAMSGYVNGSAQVMQKRMIDALEAIPGVEAVGLQGRMPLSGGGFSAAIYSDQTSDFRPKNALVDSMRYNVSPEYFRAAGTSLLTGRAFTWHDDAAAPRIAAVNRQMAVRVFGSVPEALGAYFKLRDGARVQVVAVVEDGKYESITEDQQTAIFLPILQAPMTETWLVIRSPRDPGELAPAIRAAIRKLDDGLPVFIEPWTQQLDLALFPARIAAISLGVLGAMGAMLSVTGIFGMAAYSISRRLRELGIRMALGAHRREVLAAGLGRPIQLLAIGSAAGLALGILAGRVLGAIVYQASPRDPLVLAAAVGAMGLLGVVATWIPAQRALRLDPVRLLREE